MHGADKEGFGDRLLYQTNVIAPGGTVLAGFHCVRTSACPGERVGILGRLLPPSNRFKIGRVRQRPGKRHPALRVRVPGAGALVLRGSVVRSVRRTIRDGATVALPLVPRTRVRRTRPATVTVTYTPSGGGPRSKPKRVRIARR